MKTIYDNEDVRNTLESAEGMIEKYSGEKVKCVAFRIQHIRQMPDELVKVVAMTLGVNEEDIKGKSRTREVTDVRKISAYMITQIYSGLTQDEIAQYVGWGHNSSVIDAVDTFKGLLDAKDVVMCIKYNKALLAIEQWLKDI